MNKVVSRSMLVGAVLVLVTRLSIAAGSGFIEKMPQLTQDPDRPGAMIWNKPGVNRATYTQVIIEPITIFMSPESEYKGLSADDLKQLSDSFADAVTKTLAPEVTLVDKPGPGVLHVRAAITNVDAAKKKRSLLGYTPIGFVAGAVKNAAVGPSLSIKNAVLEIETLDSVSGERVGVLVDKAPKAADTKELSWDSINQTFVYYAERFKARMLAATGK